jgi:type IV secretion system protein VirB6
MKNDLLKVIGILAIIAIIVSMIMALLGMIGSVKLTDGCFLRYDVDAHGGTSDRVTNTIMLDGAANYTVIAEQGLNNTLNTQYDPNHYGEWLSANLVVEDKQAITFEIKGDISLCKAYLPKNNIQKSGLNSDLDSRNNRVAIPRVEDEGAEPISLILDAKTDEWRNIAELFINDKVIISILPDHKGLAGAPNISRVKNAFEMVNIGGKFQNRIDAADCAEGKQTYSPLCGRYSIYSGQYVTNCKFDSSSQINSNPHQVCYDFVSHYYPGDWVCNIDPAHTYSEWRKVCDKSTIWSPVFSQAPEPYTNDGRFTSPYYNDFSKLYTEFVNLRCSVYDPVNVENTCPSIVRYVDQKNYITGDYQDKRYFWYSADGPTGLLYRHDNSEVPSNAKSLGADFKFAKVAKLDDQAPYNNINNSRADSEKYKIINNETLAGTPRTYLQYRLWSKFTDYSKNTGGYVLNIKQTKCRRSNGASLTDTVTNRGLVQYIVVPYGENPNKSGKTYAINDIAMLDSEGNAKITTNNKGNLWMKILNKKEDYPDSNGRYKVQFFTSEKVGSFTLNIVTPLFELLKGKIKSAAVTIFKNMTCYGGGVTSCTNFFNYIKAMLILYVMSYGAMFLLGMVKISQEDLVIRIAKIAIVSGLMNGSTFEFFNSYIFTFITDFSDGIISNMSGYSMFSTTNKITNPFMFLDALMSKILFGKTFSSQLFALLSMGLSGLIYFVIAFIAIIIVIITALRAIAVYIMAFMAIAVLIGIAPLFLTFMLFDFTRYLFDNWVRFTIRYMLEPVILMAGIIIMTQLFTIYLDFAIGYSVCWKCALPIKLPFPAIPGLPAIFSNLEIFCINWFAPWGMDFRSGMMGVNMQHFIALIIIAYGMYGYTEFSGKMVAKLTSTAGPSATQMGHTMSSAMEDKALKEVGLNAQGRKQITDAGKERLKNRNKTLDKANKERKSGNEGDNKNIETSGAASSGESTATPPPMPRK